MALLRRRALRLLQRLLTKLRPRPARTTVHEHEHEQAAALIRAVDAGGLPLNPARVNQIARQLGLEVSTRAPVEQTIQRIRDAMARRNGSPKSPIFLEK